MIDIYFEVEDKEKIPREWFILYLEKFRNCDIFVNGFLTKIMSNSLNKQDIMYHRLKKMISILKDVANSNFLKIQDYTFSYVISGDSINKEGSELFVELLNILLRKDLILFNNPKYSFGNILKELKKKGFIDSANNLVGCLEQNSNLETDDLESIKNF
jgi:hypothetical protein